MERQKEERKAVLKAEESEYLLALKSVAAMADKLGLGSEPEQDSVWGLWKGSPKARCSELEKECG